MPPRPKALDPADKAFLKEVSYHTQSFVLMPSEWAKYPSGKSFAWQTVPFDQANADLVPDNEAGLYSFVVRPNIAGHHAAFLLYIGMTARQSLRKRFRQYFQELAKPKGRLGIRRMLDTWGAHLEFSFTPLPTTVDIVAEEDALLSAFIPPFNEEFIGMAKLARNAF